MAKLKSARHHWWPECVSEHWKDDGGCAHWLLPDGEVRSAPPKNFGVIGNGHAIKLGGSQPSPWDENFEDEFDEADSNFPAIITWLNTLERKWRGEVSTRRDRFLAQSTSTDQLRLLVECIVSLAVRSPMFRERTVSVAEHLRGPLPEKERNSLIGLNIRRCQRMIADSLASRGKIAVLFSPQKEFIFGDGFYNSVASATMPPMTAQILAPITPCISILYASSMQYTTEPKLMTIVLSEPETRFLNETVQTYSCEAVYFRSEKPELTPAYAQGQHLQFSHPDNPIVRFIHDLPGIPPRDKSWDHLMS